MRNGVGLDERATIEMPGVQGMWSLRSGGSDRQDILALSFVSQTAFLALTSEEVRSAAQRSECQFGDTSKT